MQKYVNVNPADKVSKVPVNDGTFTMAINRASGLVSGTYTMMDGTKRPYSSMLYQKGQKAGSHGFFLVPTNQATPSIGPFGAVQMTGAPDGAREFVTALPIDLDLAPVVGVEATISPTQPTEAIVVIHGYLSSSAVHLHEVRQQRVADGFVISVITASPHNAIGATVVTSFVQTVSLNLEGMPKGPCRIVVNGLSTTVTVP
jgi:hypothetical protein